MWLGFGDILSEYHFIFHVFVVSFLRLVSTTLPIYRTSIYNAVDFSVSLTHHQYTCRLGELF
jgi:hypothetical protein